MVKCGIITEGCVDCPQKIPLPEKKSSEINVEGGRGGARAAVQKTKRLLYAQGVSVCSDGFSSSESKYLKKKPVI